MRAIGYLSVIPGANASQEPAASLSSQNEAFLAFCRDNGYEPAASFLDGAATGERVGFRQLLDYLGPHADGFVVVVVGEFRNLGPDATQAARACFQVAGRGARLMSIAEGPIDEKRVIELWKGGKPAERRTKVREAMRRRAVRGQALGRPPYGYRVGEDRRLEVVEEEAALVRHIFHLYLREGLGVRRIVKRLNEDGYRTRRDGNWSMVTVRDLLRNRAYIGTYTRFGVRVPGNHPAIVSDSDFQAVQDRMDRRRTGGGKAQPSRFLLSGLVYCGESGTRMIGVTRRQRWQRRDGETVQSTYRYYQSEARTNQSVGEYHTRRADDLEAEVLQHLRGELPGLVQPSMVRAGNQNAVATELVLAQARAETRLRTLDRRLSRSLQLAAEGGGTAERLREEAGEIVEEYQAAEEEIASIQRRTQAQASTEDRERQRARQLDRVRDEWDRLSFDEQYELLRELIDRIVVTNDGVRTILWP